MRSFLLLLAITITIGSFAQQSTTFILVRHAEKLADDPKDPNLSKEGEQRAQELKELLGRSGISVIYSTPFKRTRSTVQPIASALDLEIMDYMPNDPKALIDQMLAKHQGATILVSGHSNTTPMLANVLLGKEKYAQFDDGDYGNILIITVAPSGIASDVLIRY